MSEIDYAKVGLKSGIEIHQQLDSGKLFSRTPSFLRKDEPDFEIRRKLHAVAGEQGQVDSAVKHEAELDKEFVYEGYDDTISLVELDEAPPQEMDDEALDIALTVALLLNCKIYQTSQVMRKTVINGSNTSGFQRTVLIGYEGYVETSFGNVGIDSVVLEEDAARLVEKGEKETRFKLDRLGIPLVEIATNPDMVKPDQVKEVALKIGEILRACKVKRGIGTIRQDVNISVKGHDRVEIKGFQDVKVMKKIVDLEIERQGKEMSEGKVSGEVRRATDSGESKFLRPMPGRDRMYPETDLPLLKIPLNRINRLKKNLPKLRTEIRDELKKRGLSEDMVELVLNSDSADEFNMLLRVRDKDANLIAKMVGLWRVEIGRKACIADDELKDFLSERVLEEILEVLIEGKIGEGDVRKVMQLRVDSGKTVDEIVSGFGDKVGGDEVEEFVRKIVKEKPGLRDNAYMGLVMKEFKGQVNAGEVMEIIRKILES
jgi:Glu-tRNA(Gln) amidotransferase subunit E-like FAD-binding protein